MAHLVAPSCALASLLRHLGSNPTERHAFSHGMVTSVEATLSITNYGRTGPPLTVSHLITPVTNGTPNDILGYSEMRMSFIEDIRKLDGDWQPLEYYPGDSTPK